MGFRRKPVRMISRKVAEYKLLWIKMKRFWKEKEFFAQKIGRQSH